MHAFQELKVIELAAVLAGPSVGQFFAELGAEVIKVENLSTGGDVTRTWKVSGEREGDLSAYFCSVNWGKKSVALDLHTDAGKEVVRKLAAESDIVIASYKPGDAEKLGVDFETLRQMNPRLIYGQVTGYGPDVDRVGYDAVVQAESGFMDLNGQADGPPTKMPVALIDVLAAHQLKEGILIALLERERTGRGDLVEVSLIQTALSSLVNQASNWLVAGKAPHRQGSSHPNIAPYGDFYRTADEKQILLAVGSDRQFESLCNVLGIADLAKDKRFVTNVRRVENRIELNGLLRERISAIEAGALIGKLHALKIPAGLIHTVKEAVALPEAGSISLEGPEFKGFRTFVGRLSAVAEPARELTPPPHFGAHTTEVLARLK